MTKAAQILTNALQLPESQRALIARELVLSLDEAFDEDAKEDWATEIRKRSDSLHGGKAKTSDAKDAIRRARAILPRRKAR